MQSVRFSAPKLAAGIGLGALLVATAAFELQAQAPPLHSRVLAIGIRRVERRAYERIHAELGAEHRLKPGPAGIDWERIEHRRDAILRVAEQEGLAEIHAQ